MPRGKSCGDFCISSLVLLPFAVTSPSYVRSSPRGDEARRYGRWWAQELRTILITMSMMRRKRRNSFYFLLVSFSSSFFMGLTESNRTVRPRARRRRRRSCTCDTPEQPRLTDQDRLGIRNLDWELLTCATLEPREARELLLRETPTQVYLRRREEVLELSLRRRCHNHRSPARLPLRCRFRVACSLIRVIGGHHLSPKFGVGIAVNRQKREGREGKFWSQTFRHCSCRTS